MTQEMDQPNRRVDRYQLLLLFPVLPDCELLLFLADSTTELSYLLVGKTGPLHFIKIHIFNHKI